MADITAVAGAVPLPQCTMGQGCSRVVKIGAAVGALFVIIGITFSAIPAIPSIASSAFLGIGTPLLTISLIGALCQTNALQPATKWKVALIVSLVLFGGGIALVATTAGAPAALGTVMLTVGSSTLLTTIIGGLTHQCQTREPAPGAPPPMGPGRRLGRGGRRERQAPTQDQLAAQAAAATAAEARLREQEIAARTQFLALSFDEQVEFCVGKRPLLNYETKVESIALDVVRRSFLMTNIDPRFSKNGRNPQVISCFSGSYIRDPNARFVAWFNGDPNHLYVLTQKDQGTVVWVYTKNERGHKEVPYSQIEEISLRRTIENQARNARMNAGQ